MTNFTSFSKKVLIKFLAIVLWIIVWQLTAAWLNKPLLIPAPTDVCVRLSELVVTTSFWQTVINSFLHMTFGLLLGIILGMLFSILAYFSKTLYEILYIPLIVIKSTPVASFIILALLWIKDEFLSVFITMLMVTPIVWTNVYEGLFNTDKKLLEMSKVFGFSFYKKVKYIYIPQVKPYFLASVLTASGLGWKAGIAAEVIARPKNAIGTFLYESKVYLETVDLFAWTLVVVVVSIILEKIIKFVFKKIVKSGAVNETSKRI